MIVSIPDLCLMKNGVYYIRYDRKKKKSLRTMDIEVAKRLFKPLRDAIISKLADVLIDSPVEISKCTYKLHTIKKHPHHSYVYFLRDSASGLIKIGFSAARSFKKRMTTLKISAANKLELVKVIDGDYKVERSIHKQFSHCRKHGEWFKPSSELLDYISQLDSAK